MVFNLDPNKLATEVIFSHKRNSVPQPIISFNNTPVMNVPFHKHLGLTLDSKLNFSQHLQERFSKANRGIGLIENLFHSVPHKSLLVIFKAFVRPHLD